MYLSAHKCPSIFDLKLDLCKSKYSLAAQSISFLHCRIELSSRRRFGKGFSWPSRLGFTKRTLISKIYSVNFLWHKGGRPTWGPLHIFWGSFLLDISTKSSWKAQWCGEAWQWAIWLALKPHTPKFAPTLLYSLFSHNRNFSECM